MEWVSTGSRLSMVRTAGVKLATEVYGTNVDPDGTWREELDDRATEFYERRVGERLPWLGPEPVRTVPCLYTSTRGSRFIIDRHPDHPNVTVVSACSGHGFKHSAAIGEAVARDGREGTGLRAWRPVAGAVLADWRVAGEPVPRAPPGGPDGARRKAYAGTASATVSSE